jgi:hypothetical protein
MVLFMKMVHWREGGFNMYTKLLRLLIRMGRRMNGHCDGDGGGGSGHCS